MKIKFASIAFVLISNTCLSQSLAEQKRLQDAPNSQALNIAKNSSIIFCPEASYPSSFIFKNGSAYKAGVRNANYVSSEKELSEMIETALELNRRNTPMIFRYTLVNNSIRFRDEFTEFEYDISKNTLYKKESQLGGGKKIHEYVCSKPKINKSTL